MLADINQAALTLVTDELAAAGHQVLGHGDDPVDLRRLPVAATLARPVDQDLDDPADQRVAPGCGDGVLALRQLGEALVTGFKGAFFAASVLLLAGLVLLLTMLKQRDLERIPTDEPLRVAA